MTQMTDTSGFLIKSTSCKYDVYDQRIAKIVDLDGDGSQAATTERFVYGSNQNIALVFDGSGDCIDSTTITFLGETRSFMDKVRSLYPELNNELANYLRDFTTEDPADRPLDKLWQDRYTDRPWLPELFIQSYGEEKGKELIEKAKNSVCTMTQMIN